MSERTPEEKHRRWQAARYAELAGPDSWLGLIGLRDRIERGFRGDA